MKIFLLALALMVVNLTLVAQTSPFNPADPDVVFTASNRPPIPAFGPIAKWGHSQNLSWGGTGSTSFKSYYYKGMAFRLKFPKSYQHNVADGKKYPISFFFHGLADKGDFYDNEWQLVAGGKEFRDKVDNGEFDGFLFYHQSSNGYHSYYFQNLVELIDSLTKHVKVDPDRVFLHGLSSGGQSVWDFLAIYPKSVSHTAPLCAAQNEDIADQIKYIHIPIWGFFGGKDTNPTVGTAEYVVGEFRNKGGNIKMTVYPEIGHAVWYPAWADPGFVPFMNAGHKANPLVYFGRTEFCNGDPVNVKLGLTAGFAAYEWQKDNVTIANTNEITATSFGTYKARFKRTASSNWSEWSPAPVVIKLKAPTQTPAIQITGMKSKVIPAPDGSTTTPLELPAGYTSYEWRRTSDNAVVSTQRTFNAPVGTYNARVTEQFGCSSIPSANFTVISSSGANAPDAAKTLAANGNSRTTVQLTWTQNASHPFDETGFEIYRSTSPGGPYTLVTINPANNLSYLDQNLQPNTNYYYIVRAVNNNGAALNSNEATAKTQVDSSPPTAPSALTNVGGSQTSISLQWNASSDDVGVTKYDIYINGQKAYTTDQTSYVVYNLVDGQAYTFTVKARDQAGNVSAPSNEVSSGSQASSGLNYKYYEGDWNSLPDFNALTPVKTGITPNIDLNVKNRNDLFGILWEGYINIPATGTYTFETNSDDGSKLYIGTYSHGSAAVVNNDGLHGAEFRTGTIHLNKGVYPIAITFMEKIYGEVMEAWWSSADAGVARQKIPASAFTATLPPPPAANGLNYKYYEGVWDQLPDFNALTPLKTGNSANIDLSVRNRDDNFGIVWEGSINIPASGSYTFETSSDDGSRLYIDGAEVVNNDYLHGPKFETGTVNLSKGLHTIRITFFERIYGEVMEIWWSSAAAGISRQQIPNSAFTDAAPPPPPPPASGLTYRYYEGVWNQLPDFNALTPVKTGNSANIDLGVANRADYFGIVWEGTINIPASGFYTFETNSDDGSKVYIGTAYSKSATPLVNNDGLHGPEFRTGGMYLAKGAYPIAITFFENIYGEVMELWWSSVDGGVPRQKVPNSAFASTNPTPDPPTSGLTYKYYEGDWNQLPNFSTIQPVKTGNVPNVDLSIRNREDYFGVLYEGFINIPVTGSYTFETNSDDGSKLYIGNYSHGANAVVNNDGLHGPEFKTGTITLTKGVHPIAISYIEKIYSEVLEIWWSSAAAGITRQKIPNSAFITGQPPVNTNPTLTDIQNLSVKINTVTNIGFTATDADQGDVASVSASLPAFATLQNLGSGNYNIVVSPTNVHIGLHNASVTATDTKGGITTDQFQIQVNASNVTSVYVNLGTDAAVAPAPWNNVLGYPFAGRVVSNLKDDAGTTTSISFTYLDTWTGSLDFGFNTGSNTGIYPDVVVKSSIYEASTAVKRIRLSGLNTGRVYNIALLGSVNAGFDASSTYSVDGQSLVVNSSYNSTKAAQLNGLVPNASGEIIVSISKNAVAPYGYLNAIVIESYPAAAGIINPEKIFVEPVHNSKTTLKLEWSDRSANETGMEVWRSTSANGAYTLVATLPANTTGYTNTGLNPNTRYFYKVRGINGSTQSEYSAVASATTPSSTVLINLTWQYIAGAPWNNTATNPQIGDRFANLVDDQLNNTGMALSVLGYFNGEFYGGMNTGNNSGIVPDNVLFSSYWVDNGQVTPLKLDGLDQTKKYRVGFLGSTDWTGELTSTLTINGKTVYLNSHKNVSKIVYINDISPNADGEILMNFSATGTYGHLGALVVQAYTPYTDNGVPAPLSEAVTRSTPKINITEQSARGISKEVAGANNMQNLRAFPNPFAESFQVAFDNIRVAKKVTIEVFNLTGQVLYRKDFNLSVGSGKVDVVMPGRLQPGVYLARVTENGRLTKEFKMVKIKN